MKALSDFINYAVNGTGSTSCLAALSIRRRGGAPSRFISRLSGVTEAPQRQLDLSNYVPPGARVYRPTPEMLSVTAVWALYALGMG